MPAPNIYRVCCVPNRTVLLAVQLQYVHGSRAKKIPAKIVERAQAKLAILDGAESVGELRQPPSNMLHKLSGDRAGGWAIRINAQWRICFEFDDEAGDVEAVEISKHYEWPASSAGLLKRGRVRETMQGVANPYRVDPRV